MYKIINYAFSKRNMYFISNPNTFVFIETYHNYRLFKINENTNLHKGVGCLCFLVRWFQRQCIQTFIWAPDSEKAKKKKTKSSQYRWWGYTARAALTDCRVLRDRCCSHRTNRWMRARGGAGAEHWPGSGEGLASVPALGNRKKWQTKL